MGARLAMRAYVPVLAAALGAGFLLGNDFLASLAEALFGHRSSGGSAFLLAAICLAAAGVAAPRLVRGVDGWLRHLPAGATDQRRAIAWAAAAAQAPILAFLFVLAAFGDREPKALIVDALALLVTAFAAAQAAVPAERGLWTRPLGLLGATLAPAGGWGALGLGLLCAAIADRGAGGLPRSRATALSRRRRQAHSGPLLSWRIAHRALGTRPLPATLTALLPLGAAWAFVHHNELRPEHIQLGARFGLGTALVLLLAELGDALAVRRPAWPWYRSLPLSARSRVLADAGLFALFALPLFVLGFLFEPRAALWIASLLPLLSLRTAGAVRRAPERKSGAAGEVLAEGMLWSAACALLPWVALLALAATPWALRSAAERERKQKVSRWLELHALAIGDPQSWSAS